MDKSNDILAFTESELAQWEMARRNYEALTQIMTRRVGNVTIQYNPAREVSTGASVKESDISKRPCFLCQKNRPSEQHSILLNEKYEILLNPFPIFRCHLTISHLEHIPQDSDSADMALFCSKYPDFAVFYNGARSGASAPDHRHFQATLRSEFDVISRIDRAYPKPISAMSPIVFCDYGVGMLVADASNREELEHIDRLCGINPETSESDRALRNILMWQKEGNTVRMVVIPRKAHRPDFYGNGENQRLVSPGAVDMAGMIITPRKKDFDSLSAEEISEIFRQTGYTADELADISRYMK